MTIAPMRRMTLCGRAADKEDALAALQDLGRAHLIALREAGPLEPADSAERSRAYAAYRHLSGAPQRRRPLPPRRAIDLDAVIEAALVNKERLRVARDRADFLRARIEGLEPFGDFALPPGDALRGRRLWFYLLPVRRRAALDRLDLPWMIVGRDATRLRVAVVSIEEPPADLLPVPRTHTGARRLSDLRDDLEDAEIEIERAEAELADLTRSLVALGQRLAEAQDADDRRAAARITRDEDRLFALQAWIPAEAETALRAMAEARGLAAAFEPPAPSDEPPTLLDNSRPLDGMLDGAGALTAFYMTPAYRSWDPSLIVFFSFCMFFAMILADAGYAAALGLICALRWRRMGRGAAGRRLRAMLAAVLGTAFLYGAAAGSWFGVAPPPGGLAARVVFIDVGDFDAMMRVSIVIGVLHIALANAVAARIAPDRGAAVSRLGWIAAAFGGLAMWLAPGLAAGALTGAGLAAVFAGAAARAPSRPGAAGLVRRIAGGALALTSVTKMFGDVLSYMRLFALGLASASLAATFNALALSAAHDAPGVGVLLALLVLAFGHGANLALGVMSGVVHGLRLNYMEFFGWGLSEEGYPFKAFARREEPS